MENQKIVSFKGYKTMYDVDSLLDITTDKISKPNNYFESINFKDTEFLKIWVDIDSEIDIKTYTLEEFNKLDKFIIDRFKLYNDTVENISLISSSHYKSLNKKKSEIDNKYKNEIKSKLSYRITFLTEVCKRMADIKYDVINNKSKKLINLFKDTDITIGFDKKTSLLEIDLSVYRGGQSKMRCVNAYKIIEQKERINKLIIGTIEDTILSYPPKHYTIYINDKIDHLGNEIKELKPEKKIKKDYKKEEDTKEDKKDDDEEYEEHIKELLNGLKPSRYENYSEWINIYCIFINENLNMKLFDKFSQKSSKYNKNENQKLLKNIKKCEGLKLATLYYYLKEDNIDLFNKLQKTRRDFWFMLNNLNQSDLSKLYYSLVPNKYVRSNITGWYEYNNYNVLVHRRETPSSLLNDISNKLQNYIIEQRNLLLPSDDKYSEKISKITHAYNNLGQATYTEGIIKYLKSLYLIDELDDLLDSKNEYLAFTDYLYDIKKKCFRSIEPNDYISLTTKYKAPIKIDKEGNITAKHSIIHKTQIDKFINSIFENNDLEEYYKIITGLSLFTNKLQSLYIHVGSGGNGKGLLTTILRLCLGDYFITADNTFLTTTYKSGAPNNTLYNCKSKRYLLIAEPDDGSNDCKFNIDFIKNMSGGDMITARAVYGKNNLSYIPQFSANVQSNNIPKLGKLDKGIVRRVKIIPYKLSFVDNPKLENERQINYKLSDEFQEQDYINEFILMLIEKAQEYYNKDYSKDIKTPSIVFNETNDYINDNNPLKDWLSKNIEITNNSKDRIKTSTLNNLYNEDDEVEIRYNSKDMIKYMKFNGFEPVKYHNIQYYIKCKLIDKKNEDDIIEHKIKNVFV
jgi:phage/plasmid-associated DNA primase